MEDYTSYWEFLSQEIQNEIPKYAYDVWFRDMQLVLLTDKNAVFTVKKNLIRDRVKSVYMDILSEKVRDMLGYELAINVFSLEEGEPNLGMFENGFELPEGFELAGTTQAEEEAAAAKVQAERAHARPENAFLGRKAPNPDQTFTNFLVGGSNKFTHSAALAVANNAGNPDALRDYNPLFIHGNSGLGKSHLLSAICNRVIEQDPNANIVYVSAEDFLNEMVDAIRTGSTNSFREKFRYVRMLLIDDIQFISGKEGTQEEFFHTFNSIYEWGGQIVLTSDRPPDSIAHLADRLKTRFKSGLVTDIQPPNIELRLAYVKRLADQKNTQVPDDIANYVAENLNKNFREIAGAMNLVFAHYFIGEDLTEENVRVWLKDMINPAPRTEVTTDRIMSVVSQKYGIPVADIRSKKKNGDIVAARHKVIYLMRELTKLSQDSIGKLVGGRDHSTVINSLKNIEFEIRANVYFEREMQELIKEIQQN